MKKAYLFLAYGFEEVEALTTVDLLRRAGIEVITVSVSNHNTVSGTHSIPVVADIKIDECKFEDADAILLPGGLPGVDNLYNCEVLINLIKEKYETGKIIGAICAAPIILGRLGLLKGKKALCYPGCEGELKGAEISEQRVCTDGNIITSKGVGTAIDFALELIKNLVSSEKSEDIRAEILAK